MYSGVVGGLIAILSAIQVKVDSGVPQGTMRIQLRIQGVQWGWVTMADYFLWPKTRVHKNKEIRWETGGLSGMNSSPGVGTVRYDVEGCT
jgi:hypothetical protein